MTNYLKNQSGFTLMELVIIIIVLGIVAAVAIPKMGNITESSRITATQSEMQTLKRAIIGNALAVAAGRYTNKGFEGDVGHTPVSLAELGIKPDSVSAYNKFTRLGWNGPYIDISGNEYMSDAWGSNYIYDRSNRRLISLGGADSIIVTF